jgi:hypothetical protein
MFVEQGRQGAMVVRAQLLQELMLCNGALNEERIDEHQAV